MAEGLSRSEFHDEEAESQEQSALTVKSMATLWSSQMLHVHGKIDRFQVRFKKPFDEPLMKRFLLAYFTQDGCFGWLRCQDFSEVL